MFRSRGILPSRPAVFALAMVVCWCWAARPAGASGCHVPDRPVLGERLSWDRVDPLGPIGVSDRLMPPVLRRTPCGGEVPTPPVAPTGLVESADRAADRVTLPPGTAGRLAVGDDRRDNPLHVFRLDRPPR